MNTNYQVVIKGVSSGFLLKGVAEKLAPLFKISSDEAGQMLNQYGLVVKRGIDFQTAVKYVEALENCGCACEVQPEAAPSAEDAVIAQPSPASLSESAVNINSIQVATTPVHEVSSESVQDAPTLIHEVSSGSNPEQIATPLNEKLPRSRLIVIGTAAVVAVVVAVAGYQILVPEDNPTPSIVQPVQTVLKPTEQQNPSTTEEGEYAEKTQTVAGEVTENGGALSLNGKAIYEGETGQLSIWKTFNFHGKTVLLVAIGGMGTSCPSTFLFLTVKKNGQVTYTESFGSCSDLATTTIESESVVITIPDIRGAGDESWRYANEALSQIKYIDPGIEKNAAKIEYEYGAAVNVRGQLVRTTDGQGWELKLTRTTIFLGCSLYRLINSLPIDTGLSVPVVQNEGEFEITLGCHDSGASISSIIIPGSQNNSSKIEPVIPQQSAVEDRKRSGQFHINAGATLCLDMVSMNKARAIATAVNSYAQLPDSCVVMKHSAPTRIVRDSTPIPGVVIVEAGSNVALIDRNDLSVR